MQHKIQVPSYDIQCSITLLTHAREWDCLKLTFSELLLHFSSQNYIDLVFDAKERKIDAWNIKMYVKNRVHQNLYGQIISPKNMYI